MTFANFTQEEIGTLYRQHTDASGLVFKDAAIAKARYRNEGQPWQVNALAYVLLRALLKNDLSLTITDKHIDQTAQTLILRGDTHFDSLKERIKEPKVRRVIEALMIGVVVFQMVFRTMTGNTFSILDY